MKKSLHRFLTSESGKITKKDALGITAAGSLLVWTEDVIAGHSNSYGTSTNPASIDFYPENSDVPNNWSATETWTIVNGATCNHSSGVVNGHFSNLPSVSLDSEQVDFTKTHANHSSHSSHGSGGWC